MKYNISVVAKEEYKPQVKCYYSKLTEQDIDELWRNTISESTLLAYNQRHELEKQLNDRYYIRLIPRYEEPNKKTLCSKVWDFLTK